MRILTVILLAAAAATSLASAPSVPLEGEVLGGCGDLLSEVLDDGFELCTHGDDEHFVAAAGNSEPTRTAGKVPTAPIQCYEDGVAGPRVQVLYVHAGSNRLSSYRNHIQRWSAQVEWTFLASAKAYGASRHVRWVTTTTGSGCQVDIRAVQVSSHDLTDFGRTVASLRRAGWNRSDRKYLLFADSATYCGLAHAPRDDRPGSDNAANRTAGYARVDRPCWDSGDRGVGSVAAHEVMHTIGAVQASAPHASSFAHCTDEYDLLCYQDSNSTSISIRCRDSRSDTSGAGDHHNWRFDCNGDDYYRPNPPANSYLARKWNTADSIMLSRNRGGTGANGGLGGSGAIAIAGDWNGDGVDTPGWYRKGRVQLRGSKGNIVFSYGREGDIPIVGDWNGDGIDTLGIVRDGTWHLTNSHTSGRGQIRFSFGRVTRGDVPIVGNWDGRRGDEIGIIRGGAWHLRYRLSGGAADEKFVYGRITNGDRPLIGDWNRDGRDTIGIVRKGVWHLRHELSGGGADVRFVYGRVTAGDVPLMGDWNRNGIDTPGIVRGHEWHLRYHNAAGRADRVISYR